MTDANPPSILQSFKVLLIKSQCLRTPGIVSGAHAIDWPRPPVRRPSASPSLTWWVAKVISSNKYAMGYVHGYRTLVICIPCGALRLRLSYARQPFADHHFPTPYLLLTRLLGVTMIHAVAWALGTFQPDPEVFSTEVFASIRASAVRDGTVPSSKTGVDSVGVERGRERGYQVVKLGD